MAWVKIENGAIVQKQPNFQEGFIRVPDDVVCGMVQNGSDFVAPEPQENIPVPSDIEVRMTAVEMKLNITQQDKEAALASIMSVQEVSDGKGG